MITIIYDKCVNQDGKIFYMIPDILQNKEFITLETDNLFITSVYKPDTQNVCAIRIKRKSNDVIPKRIDFHTELKNFGLELIHIRELDIDNTLKELENVTQKILYINEYIPIPIQQTVQIHNVMGILLSIIEKNAKL